ncbi:MAG: DUF488 family protein [Burkholderiales bacterium]
MIDLLKLRGVDALVDIRSQPYSRANPQFNRETFRALLRDSGIAYLFLGQELGARSEDPDCYLNGKVQYECLAQTPLFRSGIERVIQGLGANTVALMCAEKDPLTCHRSILVCKRLVARGISVAHILEDGRLENHEEAISRLLVELGLSEVDFFKNRAEIIDEAYARRADQIAYVLPTAVAHQDSREVSG